MTSGRKLGVFCMQHGPGTENAYGGVAQAFGDSIPILVVPGGYPRPGWMSETHPNASVGANPSTPASLLEALAKNRARSVREGVAKNPATSARVLEALARDKTQEVRSSVAINTSTPLSLLEVFAKDDRTASNVAANPSTPASLLEVLATDKGVRACVAANPSTLLSLLEALAKDEKHFVRRRVRDRVR